MSVHDIDRNLQHLTYTMRQAGTELIARCAEQRVWVVVLETLRSPERAAWLVKEGKSWSNRSFHTPSSEDHLSAAMDAAPIINIRGSLLRTINWDPKHSHWSIYVEEALKLGLECGAQWTHKDWSHVQLQRRR